MRVCSCCQNDDISYISSVKLDTPVTSRYTFSVWECIFRCRTCGQEFEIEMDDSERRDYV